VVASNRILFSPSNTAAELSTADDHGLYFRTAPPDGLQARALSDIIMRDGSRRLYIVARNDAYGQGLSEGVRSALISGGVAADDIRASTYDPERPDFAALGPDVKSFNPDGVLLIGYEETGAAIAAVIAAGLRSRG
jgi:ABC-type branched-subunit amino acid transport system substrate-binding protein